MALKEPKIQSKQKDDSKTLPYHEARVGEFHLLIVEKHPGLYRLHVGVDGIRFCHYDSGRFEDLEDAYISIIEAFDPTAFRMFPSAPFFRDEVLKEAPHGFDFLERYKPPGKSG